MRVAEAEAKALLRSAGVPVPRGALAATPAEARAAYLELGAVAAVVKAHVRQGGRGKAGLVRRVASEREAEAAAEAILGAELGGEAVAEVLVDEAVEAVEECYLGVTVDPRLGVPALLLSRLGGVEVEAHAREDGALHVLALEPGREPRLHAARGLAAEVGLAGPALARVSLAAWTLTRLFASLEASVLEVNPLLVQADGTAVAADVKLELDDAAAFRRRVAFAEPPRSQVEASAAAQGLTFVPLAGEVALLGMGAGLTLTALDLLVRFGSSAANFSELPGGTSAEAVARHLGLVLDWIETEPRVCALLMVASLVGTPLESVVAGVEGAVRERPGRRSLPLVTCFHATGAALYSLSYDEGRARLEALGVRWFTEVLPAAEAAARAAREG